MGSTQGVSDSSTPIPKNTPSTCQNRPDFSALSIKPVSDCGSSVFGGVPAVAEKAHLNATQLYRTLSAEGNPELRSLTAVLKALGMRLAVLPIRHA